MIISEKKPFSELLEAVKPFQSVFLVGCSECATWCETGGETQIREVAERLLKEGKAVTGMFVSSTPCNLPAVRREIKKHAAEFKKADAVMVFSCGGGVQSVAELTDKPVISSLNSMFVGNVKRYGHFEERCSTCGECILNETGGICPVTRCPKSLLNGPCGGSMDGKCEISSDLPCAWELIRERLSRTGEPNRLSKYHTMKDYERTVKPGTINIREKRPDTQGEKVVQSGSISASDVSPKNVSGLQQSMESSDFTVTAELVPPKGVRVDTFMEHARDIQDHVVAINVNENPSSVMRMSSMAACRLLIDKGIEPVFHLTTRERNRLALQSELLGAYAMGIRNILIITGDHASMGDHREAKPVYDLDSVHLFRLATEMMGGKDYNCNDLDGAPRFYMGGVVNHGSEMLDLQVMKLKKKVDCGCRFVITQAVYDLEVLKRFLEAAQGIDVKISAGLILLKSAKMARFMNKNLPGVNVPEHIIETLEKSDRVVSESIAIARDLISGLKEMVDGVHIMPIGWYKKVPKILS